MGERSGRRLPSPPAKGVGWALRAGSPADRQGRPNKPAVLIALRTSGIHVSEEVLLRVNVESQVMESNSWRRDSEVFTLRKQDWRF